MKKTTLVGWIAILFVSCVNQDNKTADVNKDSTAQDSTKPVGQGLLENLLMIKTEAELKEKFGADHLKNDTIWGVEGNFGFGTYIDKGTKDEVQLFWNDSLRKNGVSSATATALYDMNTNDYIYGNKWSSAKGIRLGMNTDELEKLNAGPFIFSGFGWDYGGGILDWKKGKLEDCGVGVSLWEGEGDNGLSEKESYEVLGDKDVRSDNSVVKKILPKVNRITVSNI